jgi:[protein-PII] uridylyltransferase
VRTELHRRAGRAREVVFAQDADQFAVEMGFTDRFELARVLSDAAGTVLDATAAALRSARAALLGPGTVAAPGRIPGPQPLADGVVEHAGEITLAHQAHPARDPTLILRVGATAAHTGLPISTGTLRRLAERAPELRGPWPPAALAELLRLLGSGPGLIEVIETLDRTGLWGRLLPEWAAIRDLPPRDPTHLWTVDRHLVEVCAHAARLTTRVARPDLLLLGALLHDIGKGHHSASHSQRGALITHQIGSRLGLCPADVDTLTAMVRHHLLLPHIAIRHNPQDPATVQRVVDTLNADPILLELLHTLAQADARGTRPGSWTRWRATLISDLVRGCHTVIAGEPSPTPSRHVS